MSGCVQFNNVKFKYPGKAALAVKGVSFTVKAGETIALVGSSGAGNSTTLSLLYRAFDPNSGSITIDGIDIRRLSLSALRRNIGIVFQESLLLNRSIRENMLVGKNNATEDEFRDAMTRAQAMQFIEGKAKGLDEEIGERGRNLSGGERQRLSIARAILRDAPIVILDEATSSLDSGAEAILTQALSDVTKERTTLIIAHRLSTIQKVNINCHL
jgi:ATP-binding cassette subfamily B protein